MMIVIKAFVDLDDHEQLYGVGDEYPRAGYAPKPERIRELMSCTNKLGTPLIAEGPEKEPEEEPAKTLDEAPEENPEEKPEEAPAPAPAPAKKRTTRKK